MPQKIQVILCLLIPGILGMLNTSAQTNDKAYISQIQKNGEHQTISIAHQGKVYNKTIPLDTYDYTLSDTALHYLVLDRNFVTLYIKQITESDQDYIVHYIAKGRDKEAANPNARMTMLGAFFLDEKGDDFLVFYDFYYTNAYDDRTGAKAVYYQYDKGSKNYEPKFKGENKELLGEDKSVWTNPNYYLENKKRIALPVFSFDSTGIYLERIAWNKTQARLDSVLTKPHRNRKVNLLNHDDIHSHFRKDYLVEEIIFTGKEQLIGLNTYTYLLRHYIKTKEEALREVETLIVSKNGLFVLKQIELMQRKPYPWEKKRPTMRVGLKQGNRIIHYKNGELVKEYWR